jgi:fimbrial isopeptide formation D2 family protein/LPXTG-motif cell wall-anchored protein
MRWGTRLTAAVGAIALAAVGAIVGAAPASADTAPPLANIDPSATGSIIVHKYSEPTDGGGAPNAGGVTTTVPTGANPLSGVTFDVQQVQGIDLTTNAGWTTASGLSVTPAGTVTDGTTTYTLASATTQTTDGTGMATFDSLPLGVYLVTEGTDTGSNNIVAPAVPFLVTVPMPNAGEWNYTVNAYPKNAVQGQPTMAVDDSAAHKLGDHVTWTVTSTVPTLNTGGTFPDFVFTDALDSRLDYVGLTSVTLGGVTVPSEDYKVAAPDSANGNTLTITFDTTYMSQTASQGKVLAVTIDTTITAIGNGTISNVASVNGVDSNSMTTTWGSLIVQADGADGAHPLQGAVLGVYLATGDPSCDPIGTKIEPQTSDANGLATWPGLKAGSYCVQQISAPAGWTADPDAYLVTVTAGTAATTAATVTDTQAAGFTLPMTGAAGTVTFTIVGLALLAGGMALVLATRRRAVGRKAQ